MREELNQVLDQVVVHAQVQDSLLEDSPFAHQSHCIFHAFLELPVLFDELGNLLILASDDLLQLLLLILYTLQLLLVKLLEFSQMALGYLVILLSSLLVVYLGLHVGPFHLGLHLFHSRLQTSHAVFQLAYFLQLLIALLFQGFNETQLLVDAALWLHCFSQLCLQPCDLLVFVLTQGIQSLFQFLLLLSDADHSTTQSLKLIISSQDLFLNGLLSIFILSSLQIHKLSQFSYLLFQKLVIMRLDLRLLKEGATGHQHQTFLILQLLAEVAFQRMHAHPHLQHFGIEFRYSDVVTLFHLVAFGIAHLQHLTQLAILGLKSPITLEGIIQFELVQGFDCFEVGLVQGSDLYFQQLHFLLEASSLFLQFLLQELCFLLSRISLGLGSGLLKLGLFPNFCYLFIFMFDQLEELIVF